MSKEDNAPLEFSAFDLMPDWAQESSQSTSEKKAKSYEEFRDEPPRKGRRGDSGRFERRDRDQGERRNQGGRRDHGDRRGGGYRNDRRGNDRRGDDRRGNDRNRGGRGRGDRSQQPENFQIKGLKLSFEPTPEAVKSLTSHIQETVRAYPVADLAKMVASARERYQIRFISDENGPLLYHCVEDGSVWLTREEAVSHFLNSKKQLQKYYIIEEVELEAPKGNFSKIAVCGFSGEVLGPPNHHEYQRIVARIHREKFSNMSLERYKSRIEMETGEEIVGKWHEKVSKTYHFRVRPEPLGSEPEPERVEPPGDEKAPVSSESVPPDTESEVTSGNDPVVETPEVEETTGVEEKAASPETEPVVEEAETGTSAERDAETIEAGESSTPEAETDQSGLTGGSDDGGDAVDTEAAAEPSEKDEATDVDEATEEGNHTSPDLPVLTNREELERHFRQHHAASEIEEVRNVVILGNVPGKKLSPDLLTLVKQEGKKLRRGFPFEMFQAVCSCLEKEGLKFFKRGKKALHVSIVRPRAINESIALTERIQKVIAIVSEKPKVLTAEVLEKLCPDFKLPAPGEENTKPQLSEEARNVLADIRWLTREGFLVEFPDSHLELGKKKPQLERPKKREDSSEQKAGTEPVEPGATESASDSPAAENGVHSTEAPGPDSLTTKPAEELPGGICTYVAIPS